MQSQYRADPSSCDHERDGKHSEVASQTQPQYGERYIQMVLVSW